ncbi:MAG: response regulator transcription factor [Pirellulales bacterium]|nr:response regulator transcription factor [Pirellulales bacterium]
MEQNQEHLGAVHRKPRWSMNNVSPTILVVEDDAAIRRGIVDALSFEGYATLEAGRGEQGLAMALGTGCDLVLLDLVLPERDGLDILKEVRSARPTLPVIILTARGAEEDRVAGLRLGADDYVVKPFSVKELLARVQAVLRRSPERPLDVANLEFPGGELDLERRTLQLADGSQRELSERETELVRYLASNANRVISREELLSHVWRIDPRGINTRTVDMHVARLREKFGDAAEELIRTVRGKGYVFSNSTEHEPSK